jgi:hypothetical protein
VFGVGDGVTAFIGRSAPSPDQLFNVLVDGTTIPSSLSNNVTLPAVGQYSHILVGGHMGGLGFFDGDIGEVLIFDHPLSDQEESSLASYTKARWATK